MSQSPHVLILGAGLGGLALAQCLRKKGVSFQIFERDSSIDARTQGWAIALHTILPDLVESVPSDLPPIGVTDHLLPLELPAKMSFYVGGRKFSVESNESHRVIRANRQKLRNWLATDLQITWNARVTQIEETDAGVTLHFADGTRADGDILVGADGVQSQVRKHILPNAELKRMPVGCVVGEPTLDRAQLDEHLALGRSAYVAMQKNFHLFVGLQGVSADASSAKVYWLLNFRDQDAENEGFWTESASQQQLFDFATEKAKALDPRLTKVMSLTTTDGIKVPPIRYRDMVLKDMPVSRITLLGDAAHPMAPFRGEGGSIALQDALDLARAITQSDGSELQERLRVYQSEMLERGGIAVQRSRAAFDGGADGSRQAWGQSFVEESF